MGKIIYESKGRAAEYGKYAFSAYVGCSNNCTYCYLKKGRFANVMGGDKPSLKKCFKDNAHALEVFEKELLENIEELQKHGLFFSFTTDPMLSPEKKRGDGDFYYTPNVRKMTADAVTIAVYYNIPVKILTKRADFTDGEFNWIWYHTSKKWKDCVAFGFTLTGRDELDPNASTNSERIEAMRKLHESGFKTFASIEPIIDFESSWRMISKTLDFCDLYKIGLESGKKYNKSELNRFIVTIIDGVTANSNAKIYFKDGLLKQAGMNREELPAYICVTRDYNLFR
jgi:DNA repair photolyase